MISALVGTTLLVIASVALSIEFSKNRIALRRELERSQLAEAKGEVGHEYMDSVISMASGAGATNNLIDVMIGALAVGSGGQTNSQSVSVAAFDPANPLSRNAPVDIFSTSLQTTPVTSMTFPQVRFAYVTPGSQVLGRMFQYVVDYAVSSGDNLSTNASTKLIDNKGSLVVSVLELPDQLGIEGENLGLQKAPNMAITGGIAGKIIKDLGQNYLNVNMAAGTEIDNGTTESARVAAMSAGDRGIAGMGSKFVASASGTSFFIPVGPRDTNTFAPCATTDEFSRYWSPYYQCTMRSVVGISGGMFTISANQYDRGGISSIGTQGSISGAITRVLPDTSVNWAGVVSRLVSGKWMNEIEVNVGTLLSQINTDSVYLQAGATGAPVVLTGAEVLTRPFSFVSDSDVYIAGPVGVNGVPFSVLAPHVYFGHPGKSIGSLSITGQRGHTSETISGNPAVFEDGVGNVVTSSLDYRPVSDPTLLPPVYLKSWLVFIEQLHESGN